MNTQDVKDVLEAADDLLQAIKEAQGGIARERILDRPFASDSEIFNEFNNQLKASARGIRAETVRATERRRPRKRKQSKSRGLTE